MTVEKTSITATISVHNAARGLGMKTPEFAELVSTMKIHRVKNSRGKWAISQQDYEVLKTLTKAKLKESKAYKNTLSPEEKEAQHRSRVTVLKNSFRDNVKVELRKRKTPPHKSILFVGPTNSGKTYHGLEELFRDYIANPEEVHVYCGPLRLLAFEVYNKMVDRFGADNVGFITGEEAINPDAKLLATTAEMAPQAGKSILIDEAHWLAEPSRGHIWTRLLYSSEYENIYSLTAAEAVPLIQELTADAWFSDIQRFERKTPIVYKGTMDVVKAPAKTAIVCFSRKSVYTVASHLQKAGRKVGVLYGGLPLKARKKQIESYIEGKYDIMVVTDVIGHGINLPIDNVIFTQTEKFDGTDVRELYIWEGAQIAGRAGRFGLSEEGSVYLGEGLPWFSKEREIVKSSVLAAGGKIATDLDVEKALVVPKLGDLGLSFEGEKFEACKILPSLYQWQQKARRQLVEEPLVPSGLTILSKNLSVILKALGIPLAPWSEGKVFSEEDMPKGFNIDINEIWQLASGPYDASLPSIVQIASWMVSPYREDSKRLEVFFGEEVWTWAKTAKAVPADEAGAYIESMEMAIRINAELKMAMIMFGEEKKGSRYLGTLSEHRLHDAEEAINDAIIRILMSGIKHSKLGVCVKCSKSTAPWFKECDSCHEKTKATR